MEVEHLQIQDIEIFRIHGNWIQGQGETAKRLLDPYVADPKVTKMLINLAEVHSIDSSILGLMVSYHKGLERRKARFALCHLDPTLQRLMDMTQMSRILTIFPTEAEAINQLKGV